MNKTFLSDYSFISQNKIFENKDFNGSIMKTNQAGIGYELLNLDNIKNLKYNIFYIQNLKELIFSRYIIDYTNIEGNFEKFLFEYNKLETNILRKYEEYKKNNIFVTDLIYYNYFFSDKLDRIYELLDNFTDKELNIYHTSGFYFIGGRINKKSYYTENNIGYELETDKGMLITNETLTQLIFFKELFTFFEDKIDNFSAKIKNIILELKEYFNLYLEDLEKVLEKKEIKIINNIFFPNKFKGKDEEYIKNFFYFYLEKLSGFFKKDIEPIIKELNEKGFNNELKTISYSLINLGKEITKEEIVEYIENNIASFQKIEFIKHEKFNNILNKIKKIKEEKEENYDNVPSCKLSGKVYFPEYKIKRIDDFLFKDKEEKDFFLSFYEENKSFFKDEDDYILRFFSIKGFIDRILQYTDNEELKSLTIKDLKDLIKPSKKYLNYYKQLEEQIKNKTLNISKVKETILDYISEEQKKLLNKFGNININYDLYNKRYLTFKDYIKQFEYEYLTISYLGFSGYFNIVMDFINWGKLNQIGFGPGRGSAGGVLISFLLGIIDVNPIRYGLLFERMLHLYKAKGDYPDIDVDIQDDERIKVFGYLKEKYGAENVAHIGSFAVSKTKSEFKRLTKNSGIPFQEINEISKVFSDNEKDNKKIIQEIIKFYDEGEGLNDVSDTIKDLLDKHKNILYSVIKLLEEFLGQPSATGVHACGIVIASVPVEVLFSCRPSADSPLKITWGDKIETEKLGFIKFDLLGLVNVSIIKQTIKTILWNNEEVRKKYGININKNNPKDWETLDWNIMYYDILNKIGSDKGTENYNEEISVYDIFQKGLTKGVFQFESEGMKKVLKQVKPNSILELSDINALYRPGPLENIPTYIETKFGKTNDFFPKELLGELEKKYSKKIVEESKTFLEKIILETTKKTKNMMVYQEQIMFFFFKLGLPYDEADKIRKIFSKINQGKYSLEDARPYIEKAKKIFIEKGYVTELLDRYIEKIIIPFSVYAFNFSHAFAYCLIAYITGYLKKYYPTEFYASLIKYRNTPESISDISIELGLMGLELLPPNIKKSLKYPILID